MKRRSFIKNTGLGLGALAFLNNRTLAAYLDDPAFKIRMLKKDIGIFTERGGTILFMLSKEGTVIVDAQFPDTAGHLINEIRKRTVHPFRLLINTHHHGDHSSGNLAFKDLVLHVLAHENSKTNQQNAAVKNKTEDKQFYPYQTYTDIWCEKIGKEEVCLHYFGAAHTNGDSVVEFHKAKTVHMGDLVFNRRHPYVDRSSGANIKNWITVLDKTIITFPANTNFICGHAATGYDVLVKQNDLRAFQHYLQQLLLHVEAEIKSGKTLDEILKSTSSIPGAAEWTGAGVDRPLKAAFEELTNAS